MNAIATPKDTRSRRYAMFASALIVAVLGVTGTMTGTAQQPANQAPRQPQRHWYQTGRASWYGKFFQGQPTASGEAFDMNAMTCAHRTLPLGSLVRVTNLRNHRSVVVRVNDRGPLPQNRIIDLSYRAARMLGFGHSGTAPVRVDLILTPQLAQVALPSEGAH